MEREVEACERAAARVGAGLRVDAGRLDAGMAEQVGQAHDVLLLPVEREGEEMAQVVREHLLRGDARGRAQPLHHTPDVGAVERIAVLRDEHGPGGNAPFPAVAAQLPPQRGGDRHGAQLALVLHAHPPGAQAFRRDEAVLAHAQAHAAQRLHEQAEPHIAPAGGGFQQPAVACAVQFPPLAAEAAPLHAAQPHPALLLPQKRQEPVHGCERAVAA